MFHHSIINKGCASTMVHVCSRALDAQKSPEQKSFEFVVKGSQNNRARSATAAQDCLTSYERTSKMKFSEP